jgi:hypothetical protein
VVGAVVALYFNSFVLVVQSFLKIPVLHSLAPTGSELPFVVAQGVALIFYVVTGLLAVKRFRPAPNLMPRTADYFKTDSQDARRQS